LLTRSQLSVVWSHRLRDCSPPRYATVDVVMHRVRLQVRLLTSFTICTGLAGTTTPHTFALPRFWPCSRPLKSFPLKVRPFVLKGLALNLSLLSRYLTTSETAHLLTPSSPMRHWLEPTCFIDLSTRTCMGFPRSEESFVAVLGLCCTPSYLWMIVSQLE